MSGDKLVLDGKSYSVDTLKDLPEYLQPERVFTPSNKDAVCFFTDMSPLSNHYPSEFVVGSNKYNCMEQFLMFSKAMKFGDTVTANKILREPKPHQQKNLGKKVAGFNKDTWEGSLHTVLIQGLTAKFTQHQYCKDVLKATGTRQIGEATKEMPYGIGMNLKHPDLLVSSKWDTKGNIMGKCLMEVRSGL